MLAAMRRGTAGWIAKAFITLLVMSFAVWGIADIFSGYSRQSIAQVGDTEINYTEFQRDYQVQMRRLGAQLGRSLTQEEARAFGLDKQVLQGLISRAAIDNQSKELNLGISDAAIAQRIMQESSFQDTSGSFNRAIFEQLLRTNGLNENLYVARQRNAYIREQLTGTLSGEISIPRTLLRATDVYRNQIRKLKYFTLPVVKLDPIEDPAEQALQKFYDSRKSQYTAPEYRKLGIIALLPDEIAKTITISDADLKQYYEADLGTYKKKETRTIQRISFPDKASAQAAYEKIKAGSSFEEIAKERGISDDDLALGTMTKADLLDRIVADIAFALGEGEVSEPVNGQLSTVILRVTKIQPEKVTAFEDAKESILKTVSKERAIEKILDFHGKIEDERAAGAPLEEVANRFDLKFMTIPAVDRSGLGADGKAIEKIPAQRRILTEAFQSDIGLENDPVETQDQGLVWFEVMDIKPPKLKPLSEIHDQVVHDWREAEERSRLASKANDLIERARKGESLDEIANSLGLEATQSNELKRNTETQELPRAAVSQAFALSKGGFGSASSGDGKARVLFEVVSITDPEPLSSEAEDALKKSLQAPATSDLIDQYVDGLNQTYGVSKNQPLIDELTGATPPNRRGLF